MIHVDKLSKKFSIIKKRPGLRGSIIDLFNPKYIEKEAVKRISFDIRKGELVGYIGRNGAGKSTTIKMLSGVLYPDQGKVIVNGIVPHENRRRNNLHIGVVFGQRGQLWRDLAVQDSFTLIKKIYEVPEKDYRKRIQLLDEVLEIKELLSFPVRKLSLGQRMRCELAAALIHWPQIIYLDEPTIGVDLLTRKKILKFVEWMNQEYKTTIILTTHNMQDIEALCERVMIIDQGQIIFDGQSQKLRTDYGKSKKIEINYQKPAIFSEAELLRVLGDSVQVVKRYNKQIQLLTDISDFPVISQIIQDLNSLQPIMDFEIILPKLEDIIETIYERVSG